MNITQTVKMAVGDVFAEFTGAEILAPLAVWNDPGGVGVQIKINQDRGRQPCQLVANFVVTKADLAHPEIIREKAMLVYNVIKNDIQVYIRPLKALKDVERADAN